MTSTDRRLRVATVLFDAFELLDVAGPLELLGVLPDHFELVLLGPSAGPVRSAQGPVLWSDSGYEEAPTCDILLVPGGFGTRKVVEDRRLIAWLAGYAAGAEYLVSVCTGSAVLAAAGLLDGFRATSNKRAFAWATAQGPAVNWVASARWVEDGNRWTSSGVAAGMDMTLALIARIHGAALATAVADGVEYEWHREPSRDPFAAKNGLA